MTHEHAFPTSIEVNQDPALVFTPKIYIQSEREYKVVFKGISDDTANKPSETDMISEFQNKDSTQTGRLFFVASTFPTISPVI